MGHGKQREDSGFWISDHHNITRIEPAKSKYHASTRRRWNGTEARPLPRTRVVSSAATPVKTALESKKTQSTPLTLLTGQSGRPTTPHCRHSPSPASRPRPPSSLSDGGGREGRFRGALPSPHPQPPPPPAGTPDPASSPSPPLSHLPHFAWERVARCVQLLRITFDSIAWRGRRIDWGYVAGAVRRGRLAPGGRGRTLAGGAEVGPCRGQGLRALFPGAGLLHAIPR
jgi:hypothetical protein